MTALCFNVNHPRCVCGQQDRHPRDEEWRRVGEAVTDYRENCKQDLQAAQDRIATLEAELAKRDARRLRRRVRRLEAVLTAGRELLEARGIRDGSATRAWKALQEAVEAADEVRPRTSPA